MRWLSYFDICHCLLTVRRGNSRPPKRVAPRTCDSHGPQCARAGLRQAVHWRRLIWSTPRLHP